jgi:hypothetical protein
MHEVCCVLAGDKFDPEIYVHQMLQKLRQHLNDFRLTVFTDNPNHYYYKHRQIRAIRLPDWGYTARTMWWYKIYQFCPDIEWYSPVLYLDLDTIIIQDIDHLYNYETDSFCILQDFNRKFVPNYPISNSSIMRWTPDQTVSIYQRFLDNRETLVRKFRGDQDYITHHLKTYGSSKYWPPTWAMSWKWEIEHGGSNNGGMKIAEEDYYDFERPWIIPSDCVIVVFHGNPGPYETELGKQHLFPSIKKLQSQITE